jgi:hypothetical protein
MYTVTSRWSPICQYIKLFLFIRGLSCPYNVQKSVTQKFVKKLIMPGFPNNLLVETFSSYKKASVKRWPGKQASKWITAFRSLSPSANVWSGRVWQPAADSNSCLTHFLKFEAGLTAVIVWSGLPHFTQKGIYLDFHNRIFCMQFFRIFWSENMRMMRINGVCEYEANKIHIRDR